MTEGQSVSSYLTVMKEYKNQLRKMGETIAIITHHNHPKKPSRILEADCTDHKDDYT